MNQLAMYFFFFWLSAHVLAATDANKVTLVHGCANHATEGKCFCPPSAAVT